MKTFIIAILITNLLAISACSTNSQRKNENHSDNMMIFYLQTGEEATSEQYNRDKSWIINADLAKQDKKERIDYFNFTITSPDKKFTISDIDYKYGNYGKWRIIEKSRYLKKNTNFENSMTVNEFPITIKKSGTPHNQLLRISLTTEDNKPVYVNLVYGVQKCLSKQEKEFVCF